MSFLPLLVGFLAPDLHQAPRSVDAPRKYTDTAHGILVGRNRASTTPSAADATKPSRAGGIVENLPSRAAWLDAIERLARLEQPGDPSPLWTCVLTLIPSLPRFSLKKLSLIQSSCGDPVPVRLTQAGSGRHAGRRD